MLSNSLPSLLTQLCAVVTSIEVLSTGVCKPQHSHFGKGWEPSVGMQTRSWGYHMRNWRCRLNLVPDCLPHCATRQKDRLMVGNLVTR